MLTKGFARSKFVLDSLLEKKTGEALSPLLRFYKGLDLEHLTPASMEVYDILHSKRTDTLDVRFDHDELTRLLGNRTRQEDALLFAYANSATERVFGNKVYFRGIVENSNFCEKDCYYCGIRRSNERLDRYKMSLEEILDAATWIAGAGYGCVLLQSGEITSRKYTSEITKIVKEIKKRTTSERLPKGLGIILSLGEQSRDVYKEWFDAGAHRYLLRIETTNKSLYGKIHPSDHSFDRRMEALRDLQDVGYQVASGVMIGLPYQTIDDLANDLQWFQDFELDMIGMGPYILSAGTPLARIATELNRGRQQRDVDLDNFYTTLRMVSLARIMTQDINIAATTALQAVLPDGRERALLAGANVLMPIVTVKERRKDYQLYDGKPCIEEEKEDCKLCLSGRVHSINKEVVYDVWGDPPRYKRRMAAKRRAP